mgnify:FL=1
MILDGDTVFLSDIDLLLVVHSMETHAVLYAGRSRIGEACESILPGIRFEGRIDIGVMTAGELGAMSRSPGVFAMKERGVVLYGEDNILDALPSFSAGEIGEAEALKLLENRMASFLGCRTGVERPEGVALYRFLYEVSRVYTDIVTASLCAAGLYRPGYRARAGFLASSDASSVRSDLGESLVEDAMRWTAFKTDPNREPVWTRNDRAPHMWLEAAGDILAVRDRISGTYEDRRDGDRPGFKDLLRAWKKASMRPGLIARALSSGIKPEEHIREESVRLIRHAAEKGTHGDIGGAPGGYPHGRVSWEEAASRTYSEWRRLVTGREVERSE